MKETSLPPKEAFYSSLSEETCSDEDYDIALKTFKAFNCKNIEDYTKLYCLLDTLLLGEVLLAFIEEAQNDFGLDVTNYISLPQLSFDAMLKSTGVELDYIPDEDMILALEQGIRGGVSYVSTRHVDVEKDDGIIQYLDFNNLYGYAQMQKLPARNYKWLKKKEIEALDITKVSDEGDIGYILEVDLHYPESLRKHHDGIPLAPEHFDIFHDTLSAYSKECLKVTSGKQNNNKYHTSKLCGTFFDKKKYLVHYRNLKYYLKKGLIVTKTHRVIQFEQEKFALPYINFTAKKRAESKSAFKKRTANSLFGKWLQNVRKYHEVKILKKKSTVAKYLASPRFKSFRILNDNLIAVFLEKKHVMLDRIYSVGFTVLELSKLAMFQCYYDVIQPRFGFENVDVLLSDTDSFILHLKNCTREEAREKLADVMDFSNLPTDSKFYNADRKNVPGYLKDETPNSSILECIALKSKCYLIRAKNDDDNKIAIEKKCKGVTKARVKRLKETNFRNCVTNMQVIKGKMARISASKHELRTVLQNKVCLSSFDDKRYLLNCGKHSKTYQAEVRSDNCEKCTID